MRPAAPTGVKAMDRQWIRATRAAVLLILPVALGSVAQYNQRIPFRVCELAADTSRCLALRADSAYVVSSNVTTLGDLFRLCMEADTLHAGAEPVRVILAIDNSGSMCTVAQPNDPTDQRIAAAHAFLDSLAARSPESELGVVIFGGSCNIVDVEPPLPVNSAANRTVLHRAITRAACDPGSDPYPAKQQASLLTCQGNALDTSYALLMAASSSGDLQNHVVLLTDFGWEEGSSGGRVALMPDEVISRFYQQYPGEELPVTHAVFLTYNAATSTDVNLQTMTDTTGGMFIPNASPADIVDRFMDILGSILVGRAQSLYVLSVTNAATGQQFEALISKLAGVNDYLVRVADWQLAYGTNTFIFSKVFQTADGRTISIDRDTLVIVRMTDASGSPGGAFSVNCGIDSTDILITCTPTLVQVGTDVSVSARVQSDKASKFAPGVATLRGLTRYGAGDAGVAGLFRLDGTLGNVYGGPDGVGSVTFASSGAAFGSCMGGGSFTATLQTPSQQEAVYTLEAWVRPGVTAPAATLVAGTGYELSIDANGSIRFVSGAGTLTSASPIARSVWQHVAVVREGGNGQLFLNGLPVCAAAAVGAIDLGDITVGPCGSGRIDELRVSTVSRASTVGGVRQLSLPIVSTLTWDLPGGPVAAPTAPLPGTVWTTAPLGRTDFTFNGAAPADVIVNFVHTGNNVLWSAVGTPVRIYSTTSVNAVPVRAELFDTDGDGYLDQILIVLPDTSTMGAQLPGVDDLIRSITVTLPDGSTLSLQPSELTSRTDSSFVIELTENTSGPAVTGWHTVDFRLTTVPVTADGMPIQVVDLVDRAGPVVRRAVFVTGANGIDTLKVEISEPVSWPGLSSVAPQDAFVYYDAGVAANDTAFSGLGAEHFDSTGAWTVVIVKANRFMVAPLEDSLQLVAVARDSSGNAPPANGRKAPIEWGGGSSVTILAGPENPFVPGVTRLPAQVVDFYDNVLPPGANPQTTGTIIAIESVTPLRWTGKVDEHGRETFGDGVVFDVLGNVVASDLPLNQADTPRDYGVYWDGRNPRGRFVGGGTYLMVVRAVDIEGKDIIKRVKIGIKYR